MNETKSITPLTNLTIDDQLFLQSYKTHFGPLTQNLATALTLLIQNISTDTRFGNSPKDRRQIAYILATFKWETAHTMQPINEHGTNEYFNTRYGPTTKPGKALGNTHAGDGAKYHGRGYVQLTGRNNYERATNLTKKDLLTKPDLATTPQIAYQVAVQGMKEGWFTGKKLDNYIKDDTLPDYENARRIINGLDQSHTIADIARRFDEILTFSLQKYI